MSVGDGGWDEYYTDADACDYVLGQTRKSIALQLAQTWEQLCDHFGVGISTGTTGWNSVLILERQGLEDQTHASALVS